jgi:hypothetical protein
MSGRSRRTLLGVLAPLTLCAAPGAGAQQPDQPLLLPTSDVVITYRSDNVPVNGPKKFKVTYAEASKRVRIDFFRWMEAKVPYESVIFDHRENRLITVYPEGKAFTEGPAGDGNPGALLRADVTFSRRGKAVVAHAPCTEWLAQMPGTQDEQDTACVTDDGIVLRLVSSKPNVLSMTAIAIHYGTPPDGTFDLPAGFRRQSDHDPTVPR